MSSFSSPLSPSFTAPSASRFSPQGVSKNLLSYTGTVGSLYGIWFKNLFFIIITFMIYRPWARSRVRRYIWSKLQIDGDPLLYTGTGKELFIGFLKIAALYFVLSLLPLVVDLATGIDFETMASPDYEQQMTAGKFVQMGLVPLFLYLAFSAQYAALRYRLTRTHWRGIRGHMRGSALGYGWLAFKRFWLNILSLGLLIPKSSMILQAALIKEMAFGSQKLSFNPDPSGLQGVNITTLLLSIPTLFMVRFWYYAALKNKVLAQTTAGSVHFKGTYSGGALLWMTLSNMIILIATLGLGIPYIMHRMMRFHIARTQILGDINGTTILQAPATDANTLGEGIEDDMDTGIDLDFGLI